MDVSIIYGLYTLLGVLAGLFSGLLGIGGGVIVIPGFVWLFQSQGFANNLVMHLAVGTSLAAMVVTSAFSAYAHYRQRGALPESVLYLLLPGLIIGTASGALLAYFIHSEILKISFGLLMLLLAYYEYTSARKADEQTSAISCGTCTFLPTSVGIGLLAGLLGVGGGTVTVPFLEYCGINMKKAVDISIVGALVCAITGAICFMLIGFNEPNLPKDSFGYIYLPAFLGVAIGSPIFTLIGTKWYQSLNVDRLKQIFSIFLLLIGLHLLIWP